MYGYVYLTTNLVNGKRYIGQHKADQFEPQKYIGSGVLLAKAISKYGKENFDCILIQECETKDILNENEIFWIADFNAVNDENFYNICSGGLGHSCDPWNKGVSVPLVSQAQFDVLEFGRHLPASEKLKEKLRDRYNLVEYTSEYRSKLSKATTDYFRTHDIIYMMDLNNKKVRVEISDVDEKLALGWTRILPDINKESLYHLYVEKNMSRNQIAEKLNCKANQIKILLKKYNISKLESSTTKG